MRRLLPLLLLLVACGGRDDLGSARARWEQAEPAAYAYVLRSGAQSGVTATRFTVRDGRVVAREVLEGEPVGARDLTVDDVLDLVEQALRTADEVDVAYDDRGLPVRVSVDEDTDAIDDEHGFGVAGFTVLPTG